MPGSNRIRKNSFFSFLSISLRLIANVIVFWIIARFYGPSLFGQFTFAQTLASIFILFGDFGFDVLLTNEISRNRNNAIKIFRQFFSLKLVFTFFALVGMWVFVLINNFSVQARILIIVFSFYMVFTTLTNFLYALYKGFERLEYETKVSLTINFLLLVTVLILIFLKIDLIFIAIVFVLTRLFGFGVAIKYSREVLQGISFRLFFKEIRIIKNKVFVYGFHLTFSYLFFQLDTILLAFWKGDYDVGIYQAVFKLIAIPLVIPEILVNALMPTLSRLYLENKNEWARIGMLMNKLLVVIILPISIILYVYADQIIHLIYGTGKFIAAIPLLRIFALTLFVRFNLETFALMLTTSDRQKVRMFVVLVATFLNLAINYFMIPRYGVYGAALASLGTNVFVGICYVSATSPLFLQWMINIKTAIMLIVSFLLAFLLWKIKLISIFISVPTLLLFLGLFSYYFYFNKEEKRVILLENFKFFSFFIFKNQ